MPIRTDVAGALGPWLAARLDADDVVLDDVRRHAEGWSWQTWTLTATWKDHAAGLEERRGFAVRIEPEDGLLAPYDIEGQYHLHGVVLGHSQVPMADLFWLELDPSVLGMPFYMMERVEGVVPVQWRGDDPEIFPTPEARRDIGHQFVDIEAEIHGIDWASADLDALPGARNSHEAPQSEIERWERYYRDSTLIELPVVNAAIAWLRANVACTGRLTLCHGDYRIGNFMLRDGRIIAIFDWELAHIGDPVEDIAYSGLPLFRGRNPLLSHLLAPAEYFARYEARTGQRVEPEVFHFWTVLGLLKATASHIRGTRAYEDRRADDVRLAAMGHQSLHVLRHLVNELGLRRVR
ncbi:MAG: phosphotransferase family protein [Acidimicrobiales bacterium]